MSNSGKTDGFAIWQKRRTCGREVFTSFSDEKQINSEDYFEVYHEFGSVPEEGKEFTPFLESLFVRFNVGVKPLDYRGWPLSVSDIIELRTGDKRRYFYVDSCGFVKLEHFKPPVRVKAFPLHAWGQEYLVALDVLTYVHGNRLCIYLECVERDDWSDDYVYTEPYSELTVNLQGCGPLDVDEAYICGDGQEYLLNFILENKLGEVTDRWGHSGMGAYPVVKFDMEKLHEYDPEGVSLYLKDADTEGRWACLLSA